jgi:hypothetical protein
MGWVPDELRMYRRKVIADRYSKEGSVPIARDLGLTRGAVLTMAKRMGLVYADRYKHHSEKVKAANKSCNHAYFKTWSPNMAYILGYIYADGCIDKAHTSLCLLCHSKDEEIIVAIHKELNSLHRISRKPARVQGGRNNGPQTACSFSSMQLVDVLVNQHGMRSGKSNLDLSLPHVPDAMFWHFFRGYMDGDGSIAVYQSRGVSYGTLSYVATPLFGKQLADKASVMSGASPKRASSQGKIHSFTWRSRSDILLIGNQMYPTGEYIFLKRKRDAFYNIASLK